MNTDTTKRNKGDSKNNEKDIPNSAAPASITSVGDTSRDITDTADIARASIAKQRGVQESKTAATAFDIAKGEIDSDESIIQGTTTSTTEDDNIPKEKEEVVSSGTSLSEDKSIDKANIYSTEETGTRNLDKAQEKPVKKVEDKESGSWRIEGEEEH
jgi:hypothetical protein